MIDIGREEVSAAGWVAHALRAEIGRLSPDRVLGRAMVRQPHPNTVETLLPSGTVIRLHVEVEHAPDAAEGVVRRDE